MNHTAILNKKNMIKSDIKNSKISFFQTKGLSLTKAVLDAIHNAADDVAQESFQIVVNKRGGNLFK